MELVNRLGCDPVVVFSPAEVRAELQRWNQAVPSRGPQEPEPLYLQRLRLVSDGTHTCTCTRTHTSSPDIGAFSPLLLHFHHLGNKEIKVKVTAAGRLPTRFISFQTRGGTTLNRSHDTTLMRNHHISRTGVT